jgi:hypothetical protein
MKKVNSHVDVALHSLQAPVLSNEPAEWSLTPGKKNYYFPRPDSKRRKKNA